MTREEIINSMFEDELHHYGVIGMKWGVRKERPTGNRRVRKLAKRDAKMVRKGYSPKGKSYTKTYTGRQSLNRQQRVATNLIKVGGVIVGANVGGSFGGKVGYGVSGGFRGMKKGVSLGILTGGYAGYKGASSLTQKRLDRMASTMDLSVIPPVTEVKKRKGG